MHEIAHAPWPCIFHEHRCKNVFVCIRRRKPIQKYACIYVLACLPTYVHTLAHKNALYVSHIATCTHSHTHMQQEMRYVKPQEQNFKSTFYLDTTRYTKALTYQNFRQNLEITTMTLCSPRGYQQCSGLSMSARARTHKHANTHTSTKGGGVGRRRR